MGDAIRQAAAHYEVSPSTTVALMRCLRQTTRCHRSGSEATVVRYWSAVEQMLVPAPSPGDGPCWTIRRLTRWPYREGNPVCRREPDIPAARQPDLNRIEQFSAKLKALPRKSGARTKEELFREALWTTIGGLLNASSPEECRHYLRNCGYEPV